MDIFSFLKFETTKLWNCTQCLNGPTGPEMHRGSYLVQISRIFIHVIIIIIIIAEITDSLSWPAPCEQPLIYLAPTVSTWLTDLFFFLQLHRLNPILQLSLDFSQRPHFGYSELTSADHNWTKINAHLHHHQKVVFVLLQILLEFGPG
jgi:hypothetical protein